MQSEQINEIAKALAAAQVELTNPHKNKTAKAGTYTYKYADIADVLDCVRPVLAKQGIAISQPTIVSDGALLVQTRLTHLSGQWMSSDYPVCQINGKHQDMGSALTYARRYALTSMVGVAAEEDTDGQGAANASAPKRSTVNPKTGRQVNPNSSSQAKVRGDWEMFQQELSECGSLVSLASLRADYRDKTYPGWTEAWRQQAEEAFDARQAELTAEDLGGALEASVGQTRAEYVQACHDMIDEAKTKETLAAWWNGEKAARVRFSLSQAEVDALKERVSERKNELDAELLAAG